MEFWGLGFCDDCAGLSTGSSGRLWRVTRCSPSTSLTSRRNADCDSLFKSALTKGATCTLCSWLKSTASLLQNETRPPSEWRALSLAS